MDDIIETARECGSFKTLLNALETAGLKDLLINKGPFTLYAPDDDAFSTFSEKELDNLLADKEELKQILLYHITGGKAMLQDAVQLKSMRTLQGGDIIAEESGDDVNVNNAKVVHSDIECTNGVIHSIDRLLNPE
ncbi:beta-Ig-H3/fasciclin [Methanohalobium evestigatum Z-7303]|uniref:Beta-Ig-H3/fasciclin n=1 Tax=Methanohalobium evestigatum (strain ATCC BAA-1072 / DSM 3721 / NBRC 107634 / OCM 161 / Z-7303) TaxID=644295 RepID=D7E890_METEZ|nr:fasciclin domain-containing protein [Methanohalobium evestigatum]ADI73432.1 beta-Ig-H3/fasciclin [Methanohalobium evestigatum Z-7303]